MSNVTPLQQNHQKLRRIQDENTPSRLQSSNHVATKSPASYNWLIYIPQVSKELHQALYSRTKGTKYPIGMAT